MIMRCSNCTTREAVDRFRSVMLMKLEVHENKGGWHNEEVGSLIDRIREECDELEEAVRRFRRERNARNRALIASEAADVANFAMMVADITQRWPTDPE